MWFTGSIVDAIKLTKQKNAIFVVYVEGKDDDSKKLNGFLNDTKIRSQLSSEKFIAIRIEGGSENYMQFASIYQIVPVPSLFFIGKNGAPLEIGTCALDSVGSLLEIIERAEKNYSEAGISTVTANQPSETLQTTTASEKPSSSMQLIDQCSADISGGENSNSSNNSSAVVEKKTENSNESIKQEPPNSSTKTPISSVDHSNTSVTAADLAARVEETRKALEQKRRERIEEEKRLKQEQDISQRKGGKNMMSAQEWQKEQELRELKDNIRRERREEKEARQRILEKIASDRAERAQKFATETCRDDVISNSNNKPLHDSNMSRLHFRLPDGSSRMDTFNNSDTFNVVRTFVQNQLLSGTGIKKFTLATAYPKREFNLSDDLRTIEEHGLCPTAVILVISKQPITTIAHSEKIKSFLNFAFWTLVSPILALFDYFKRSVMGGENTTAESSEKNGEKALYNRSSIDRSQNGPSTSKNSGSSKNNEKFPESYARYLGGGSSNIHRLSDNHDTDDENATWNGNSTQQQ